MSIIINKLLNSIGEFVKPDELNLTTARKRFYYNLISNGIYVGFSSIVTLWMTPFLIKYLGIAAFGMIPLANTIISYGLILTNSLNSAISRFLALELGKGDQKSANRTFNTAFFTILAFVLVLGPIAVFISFHFPDFFNVPAGFENASRWLFLLIASSFFLSSISSNFSISTFIHSHFVLRNIIGFGDLLIRVVMLVLLYTFLPVRLWYSGVAVIFGGLFSMVGFYFTWRRLTPELSIRIRSFNRSKFFELSEMGIWVVVNTLGTMLLGRVDLIIVNAYFGATITGGYASITQFSIFLEYLVSTADNVVRPALLLKYANNDFMGLREMASKSVRFFGLILALPVGYLCGFSRPILSVWLGPEYQYLYPFLVILSSYQSLSLSIRPLLRVNEAYNKVRVPGIVTLISGGVSLGLSLIMAKYVSLGAAGVALAIAFTWTLRNAIFLPLYTAYIMKVRWWTYFTSYISTITATVFSAGISLGLSQFFFPKNWFELGASVGIISAFYLGVVWVVGMRKTDRQFLINMLPWK
jgi:O-antigen/teichoic acid export membrane protein